MSSPTSQSPSASAAPRRKSTLFCPACGHASPVDGDWQVHVGTDRVSYGCPVCDETITERPAHTGASSMSHGSSGGESLIARSARLSLTWMAWPCTQAVCGR